MFACADFRHPPFARLRKSPRQKTVDVPAAQLLLGGPSRNNPIKLALRRDIMQARSVRIICAYFLPTVENPAPPDARGAARCAGAIDSAGQIGPPLLAAGGAKFYRRLLAAGVEIYEYQPQILHAKMFLLDDVVYAGSANLDPAPGHQLRVDAPALPPRSGPAGRGDF
jgi:cardiolipin synthase A/B